MKINKTISVWLRVLSFVAACCVVLIHSNTISFVGSPTKVNSFCHHLFCQVLTSWAVPYFFVVSGFFFALSDYMTGGGYKSFVIRKVHGLLVPYILWGVIGALISAPVSMLSNHIAGRPVLEHTLLAGGIWYFFDSLFGIVRVSPLHNGVLWYVKALFIIFLFAFCIKHFANRKLAWVLVPVWLILWLYCPSMNIYGFKLFTTQMSFFFLGVVIAVYMPAKWRGANTTKRDCKLPYWISWSFWIYCTHDIILTYVLSGGHYILGKSNLAIAILTPTAWIVTVCISLLMAKLLHTHCSKIFMVLNGGR